MDPESIMAAERDEARYERVRASYEDVPPDDPRDLADPEDLEDHRRAQSQRLSLRRAKEKRSRWS